MRQTHIQKLGSLFLFPVIVCCFAMPLHADGGMVFTRVIGESSSNPADSPNQRALIIHDGSSETLIVQIKYQGEPADFSWVIPVPNVPDPRAIQPAEDEIFDRLHSLTQPSVLVVESIRSGRGDSYEGGPDAQNLADPTPQLQVWEQLEIGPYVVTTLSASAEDTLINWLVQNGYQLPQSGRGIVESYIQKKWCFVAVKVNMMQKNADTSAKSLVPLAIRFKTEQIIFPLEISKISAAPWSEILLYVLSGHRVVSNYATKEIDANKLFNEIDSELKQNANSGMACSCKNPSSPGSFSYDYEAFFQRELNATHSPTFFIEYADYFYYGSIDEIAPYLAASNDYFITRFRTYLSPQQMEDVVFTADPQGDRALRLQMVYHYSTTNAPEKWFLGFTVIGLVLLPVYMVSEWRRKFSRKALLAILIILLMV